MVPTSSTPSPLVGKTLDFLTKAYEATKSAEAAIEAVANDFRYGVYLAHLERAQLGLADARVSLLRLIDEKDAWE